MHGIVCTRARGRPSQTTTVTWPMMCDGALRPMTLTYSCTSLSCISLPKPDSPFSHAKTGVHPRRLNFGPIVIMCRRKKVRSSRFAQVAHHFSSQSTCSSLITWQPPTTSCISPAKPGLGSPCKCPGGVGRYPGDQHSVAGVSRPKSDYSTTARVQRRKSTTPTLQLILLVPFRPFWDVQGSAQPQSSQSFLLPWIQTHLRHARRNRECFGDL
ncbi:hypothetical protein BKA56DRAFT_53236 [Ilyonectria sp. MPI-CAGE-AT-0026]|nr:hypothetical protein BKA56DRAFT_53236 [Ilyonectria sp. MPI-CAGE-AT-0026]